MIMRLIFLLSLLAILSSCSQRNFYSKNNLNYSFIYKDKLEENSELIRCWINYSVEKKGDEYIVKQYYYGNYNLTHYKTFSDEECTNLNGKYIEWYDNGKKRYEGVYKNGKAEGIWKMYNYISRDCLVGEYINGKKENKWKIYDSTGLLEGEYTLEDNRLNGPYKIYNNKNEIIDEGLFQQSELIYYKDEKVDLHYLTEYFYIQECNKEESLKEKNNCSYEYIADYLSKITYYPWNAFTHQIEGVATIIIVLNDDDTVREVIIAQGLSDDIKEELEQQTKFLKYLNWKSGKHKGNNSECHLVIPFTFRIKK